MSLARHAPLVIVLAGAGLLFPLQGLLDRRRAPDPDILEVLPPARLLPVLAFGHEHAAADLLELRANNFLMRWLGDWNRLRHDHLTRLYDAVLELDPEDASAYLRVATYLFAVADRADLARAYLERGIARVPVGNRQRWRLFLELASLELLSGLDAPEDERLVHVRASGAILARAVGLPGAPAELEAFADRLSRRGLSRLETLLYEEGRWLERTTSGEPAMRAEAQERLVEVRAALVAEALQQVVDDLTRQRGRPPRDLDELRQLAQAATRNAVERGGDLPGVLRVLAERGLDDPLGVGFRLEGGQVLAPGVEARRLQRSLEERFLRWQQEHPGQVPTLGDLGVADVTTGLHVEVSPRGVAVTVRPR